MTEKTAHPEQDGLQNLIGYTIEDTPDERCRFVLEVKPEHTNRSGLVHSAVLFALGDRAMDSVLAEELTGSNLDPVLADTTIHFLRPIRTNKVYAQAMVLRMGRRLAVCEAELRNAEGVLTSRMVGAFALNEKE